MRSTSTLRGGPILLVEAYRPLRESLVLVLQRAGYAVIAVSQPGDAIHQLQERSFALVLAGCTTALLTSVAAVTERLRAAVGSTPLVLLTADPITVAEGKALGFRDVITKPFANAVLLRAVRASLKEPPSADARPLRAS